MRKGQSPKRESDILEFQISPSSEISYSIGEPCELGDEEDERPNLNLKEMQKISTRGGGLEYLNEKANKRFLEYFQFSYSKKSDNFMQEMDSNVDNTLKIVAGKIAEKKRLEHENTLATLTLKETHKRIESEVKTQNELYKKSSSIFKVNERLMNENEKNERIVNNLEETIQTKSEEINKELKELVNYKETQMSALERNKNNLSQLQIGGQQEKQRVKINMRILEEKNSESIKNLDILKKKYQNSQTMENERLKLLKGKAAILHNLISSEELNSYQSSIKQDIGKILSSSAKSIYLTHKPMEHVVSS